MKVLRVLANWIFVILSPFWALPLMIFELFKEFKDKESGITQALTKGTKWFWE